MIRSNRRKPLRNCSARQSTSGTMIRSQPGQTIPRMEQSSSLCSGCTKMIWSGICWGRVTGRWSRFPPSPSTTKRSRLPITAGLTTVGRKEGEALHPARQSLANLAQKKIDQGPYAFASQYQQRPAPAGGGDIELQWFGRYDLKNQPQFIRKIQVWDNRVKRKGTPRLFCLRDDRRDRGPTVLHHRSV